MPSTRTQQDARKPFPTWYGEEKGSANPRTVSGVIDTGSRYVTALGKLLRGHLGPMIDLRKVRQVDQNGPNGKTPGFDPG